MSDSEKVPEGSEPAGSAEVDRHDTEAAAPPGTDGPDTGTLAEDTGEAAQETAEGAGDAEFPDNGDTSQNGDKGRESPDVADDAGESPGAETPAAPAAATKRVESEEAAETNKSDESGEPGEVAGETASDGVEAPVAGHTKSMPAASSNAGGPPPGGGRGTGGGGGGKKPRSRRSRLVRRTLFLLLGLIGFCVVAFGVAYLFTPVPSPQEKAVAQGPTFYYSDGKTQIAKTGINRDAVKLDQIPESTRNAVIAAENGSFYDDPGVSVQGTTRAFWSTVTGRQLQGGSTITQQMVRNYYGGIGKERSVTRKLKEIMVALKVDQSKSKDWILEQYLNTIYFGRNAYGVQAAAHAYYDKDVSELTPAEGAYLAAAIQQPSNFSDPTGDQRAPAEQRWRAVLGNMARDGYLTSADAAALKFPVPDKQKITDILKGQKGYMVNVAKKELTERRGYSEDEINRSGLKITTTFDKRLMDAMKQAVTSNAPDGMSKKIRTGAVSVDPSTGQVLAFYGGRGYLNEALSSAFGDHAQAGSGFKPIALAAALQDGRSLNSTYDGSSPQTFAGSPIHNDSNESFGMVNLVTATQHSINTAYVNLGRDIGNEKIAEMAEKMGISASQMTKDQRNAATFPLGIVSLHPVQQAGVYATFASEGVHKTPFVVKSVTDNEGHKRSFTEKGNRALSAQNARDATYAMQRVVQGGTGTNAQLPDGRDVAGKTGTTDKGKAIWFNGFIPQMATSVAMFRSDGKPLNIPGYGAYGGQLPAQVWRSYMTDAVDIKDYEPKSFGSPSSRPGGSYGGPSRPSTPGEPQPPRTNSPSRRPPATEEPDVPTPPTDLPTIIEPPDGGGGGNGGGDDPGDGGGNDGGGGGGDNGGGGDGGGGRLGSNG